MKLLTQNTYLPQLPVLVRVEIRNVTGQLERDLWDAEATLTANQPGITLSTNKVVLRNGMGSALIRMTGGGNFTLTASIGSLSTNRSLQDVSGAAVALVGGTLAGASTTWSGVIRATNDVTVPVGHTLTIGSNTIVMINGVASGTVAPDLLVNGTINSLGTELHPVTITCADANLRWGQIRHNSAQPSLYRHTTITRAGRAPGEGHTGQAPVVRPNASTIIFENCNITDHSDGSTGSPGKIMYAIDSDLTFRDCILARARMGPEIQGTALFCTNTWLTDMRGPDDSDGIYLHGQQAGQQLKLTDCVLAAGDDDGIDTLDSTVHVENSIIRDWTNPNEDAKGISVFNRAVHVQRCLIVNCWVAISAKWSGGSPAFVTINQSTLIGISNTVGATWKANAPGPFIDFRITNSILWGVDALKTDFGPTNFTVHYCDVSESWPGMGNLSADPLFVDGGANDYHLQPGSPCIDAGNPASPLDADGTLVEMGAFPFLPTPNPLIPLGSIWRYLDNGSDQGTNWTARTFDDSSWAMGPAQLGYSSDPPELDEATMVSFGPDPNNKYITTYFRKSFFVGNPAAFSNLQVRLLQDDGAVVYLNGQEIWRTNMPPGAMGYQTLAASTVGGVDEGVFLTNIVSASNLLAGMNVVAVEMHQVTTNSSDLSFELELLGLGGNTAPFVSITNPLNNALFAAPADIAISASASDPDGTVSKVEFFQNGAKLGEDSSEPFTQSWNGVPPGIYALTAVATDNVGASRTSAVVNVTVNSAGVPTTNTLVALGSMWKYLDDGSDQGTDWSTLGFDDTVWLSGPAALGYCSANCGVYTFATTVGYGPDVNNKYVTTYFRTRFVVPEPSRVLSLLLNLLRDDGAVVHINGQEVYRANMGTNNVNYLSNALIAANYGYEQTTLPTNSLAALLPGTNVLAVEIHQANGSSSDIVLDAALAAVVSAATNERPIVSISSPANNSTFGAPASFTITAAAFDVDGNVTNVEFFANSGKLGEDVSSPYAFNWSNVIAGVYTLTAVASDNVGLRSTSTVINVTVSTNIAPPTVLSKSPVPGAVTNLNQITVTFSKTVLGVDASDLLVKGVAATGMSGSGSNYTFTFASPGYGTVSIAWAAAHGITDVFTPPQAFNANSAGAAWQYQFNDVVPPVISVLDPVPGSTVAALTSVSVSFNEAVTGVNASDLLINSVAASTLSGSGAGPYVFGFPPPAPGVVPLGWAGSHGIRDTASNAFVGASWSYDLNTNASGVVISEIMYHPSSENILEEYIELFNKGAASVNLTGWRFSAGVQFTFPNVSIAAGGYLAVAADLPTFTNKYPGVVNVVGGWSGFLNNSSEDIDLDDAQGERVDSVRYADEGDWAIRQRGPNDLNHRGWVWFKEHDGLGKSLELINPNLSNNSGQNWASSRSTNGTPGAANSVQSNNVPPMILDAVHFPLIPTSSDPVLVTARIVDESPSGLIVTLSNRVSTASPPPFSSVSMRDDGLSGDAVAGDGIHSALLPSRTNHTVVEYYISATDQHGARRTWPAPAIAAADGAGPTGQVANALFQVDDSIYNPTNKQPLYKFVMTETERAELQAIPSQSNLNGPDSQMNGTFICLDGAGIEWRYLVGIRNRGHGSRGANPPNYRVNFRSDDPWKGVTALNINAVGPYVQHIGSVLARKAGIAGAEAIAVQVRVNNQNRAGSGAPMFGSYVANEVVNSDWSQHHLPLDPNGNVYRVIRDIAPPDLSYRGEDPNSYRNTWFKESNVSEDDWSDLIGMLRVVGVNNLTPFTTENVRQVIHVEQWLRHLAVMNIFGNAETGLNSGFNDDYFMYRGVNDPRFILMYWDLDQILGFNSFGTTADIFSATANNGAGQALNRFMRWPDFEPIYLRIMKELMETTFSQANFDALVDQTLGSYVEPGPIGAIKNWMNQRRSYILGLPAIQSVTNVPLSIATISGLPRSPTPFNTATLTVGGLGVVAYRYQLNGAGYGSETPVATPISLSGLLNSTNTVSVIARNSNGLWQAEASATVRAWVVNSSWPRVRLNEVLARNDSAVNHFATFPDLIELFNESSSSIDLSGLRLTDDPVNPNKFTFPGGTTLAAGAYLVVYANDPDGTPGLHLGFGLEQDGEGVYLFDRVANGNTVLDSVTFGLQLPDRAIGRISSGDWLLTQPTLSGANVAQLMGNPRNLKINEWQASGQNPYPDDFIELYNPDPLPVALGGLSLTDQPIGAPARHPITPLSFVNGNGFIAFIADSDPSAGADHLNFRLALEQGEIGLTAPDLSIIDCVIYGPQQTGISFGRCPDGALQQKALTFPTPGGPNGCPFVPPPPASVSLLTISNLWKYEESGTNLGTAWILSNYDDSTWPSGAALLGFDSATLPEPFRTTLTLSNTKTTYYFRAYFNVASNLNVSSLQMRHIVDDGIVVYLNTNEVHRYNLPAGPIAVTNLALTNIADATYQGPYAIPVTNLIPGLNVIAVELHQSLSTSGDLAFGLELTGIIVTNSPVAAGVLINEVLANNATLEELDGSRPDWVEIYNPSSNAVDLANMSLTDILTTPRRWVFPAGSLIPAFGFLKVRMDGDQPISSTNTGFALKANGGAVYLFNRLADGGGVASSITYGLQAGDWSIGRVPDGTTNWVLTVPTFGAANLAAALGDPMLLKVNEWMASPASGEDWFEIFNPNPQPVNLSRLWLSDHVVNRMGYQIPALSFMGSGPEAFQRFEADDPPTYLGAEHVNFKLDGDGEALAISTSMGGPINSIGFGQQQTGVSQGRLPDGSPNFPINFPTTPTPGKGNFLPLNNVVVNELLTHSDAPLEDTVEFYNPSGDDVNISGWYLSDSQNNLLKYRIPTNMTVPARGYLVFYEYQFNGDHPGEEFSFSSARGDEVYLSQASGPGVLTGYRAFAAFGPAENGVSFGRFQTSVGADFTAMSARTFGVDNPTDTNQFRLGTGRTNAYPKVGPVVINEIMYNPSVTNDALEFVELHNILGTSVSLFDPNNPQNTWRLRKGIDFNFPQGTVIPAGGFVVIVSFDPLTDPGSLAAFRSAYGTNMTLLGPYSGKLDNGGEDVELRKPDLPQTQPGPDLGLVPYVVVDRVQYDDAAPWPTSPDGTGPALKRITASLYGNDPVNWTGGTATPGAANFAGSSNTAPVLGAIGNKTINEGSLLTFTAMATDADLPAQTLTFSLDGAAPAGATINSSSGVFNWSPSEAQGPGVYPLTVRVADSGSPLMSDSETISITVNEVNTPPVLAPIGNKMVNEGSPVTFAASAADADVPVQALTYTLDAGAPSGASINATNGSFAWTPSETHGPGSYPVTIRVTDNGSPPRNDTETITISVNESNVAPVLAAIGNKSVTEGNTLTFTASATDSDSPAQMLSYSLDAGAPGGATIHPISGVFTWTPTTAQGPSTNPVTIRVTDNGSPALGDFETITVVVIDSGIGAPRFTSITIGSGVVTLQWSSHPGKTYRLQRSIDLVSWINLGSDIIASAATTSTTDPVGGNQQRFYRVLLMD